MDLIVSNMDESAQAILAILCGEKNPRRDIALLNAAAALVVAGKTHDLPSGLQVAAHAIESGAGMRTLEGLIRCAAMS